MIVKITKCSNKDYWYANLIGKEYNVFFNKDPRNYTVLNDTYHSGGLIDQEDCLVVDSISVANIEEGDLICRKSGEYKKIPAVFSCPKIKTRRGIYVKEVSKVAEFFDLENFDLVTKKKISPDLADASQEVPTYDHINPDYYKKYSYESIDMIEKIYGKEYTAMYCEINAFKYSIRIGLKVDQPVERDLKKRNWYLNKAQALRIEIEKLKSRSCISGD